MHSKIWPFFKSVSTGCRSAYELQIYSRGAGRSFDFFLCEGHCINSHKKRMWALDPFHDLKIHVILRIILDTGIQNYVKIMWRIGWDFEPYFPRNFRVILDTDAQNSITSWRLPYYVLLRHLPPPMRADTTFANDLIYRLIIGCPLLPQAIA